MTGAARQRLGALGERLAATHLESKGLTIRARNWRCARGEIDLVAEDGVTLVFVEVKTRRGSAGSTPEEAVSGAKARRLLLLAQQYLLDNDLDIDWRVDVVAVQLDGHGRLVRCEHMIDAVRGW